MIKEIDFHIEELDNMKKYPKELFYIGNTSLLQTKKISMVGSRRPNGYTRRFTFNLAKKLTDVGITIVSGGAMGVDGISHSANTTNTICVVANGLDIRYPAVNKNLISSIEQQGLVLSQFRVGESAKRYSFVIRNEIVVALGDILIVTEADKGSGSLKSVEYAKKMGKDIYVLPHRIGESEGTNKLLERGLAKAIYDIDDFVSQFGTIKKNSDKILEYFLKNPIYDEAVELYQDKIFEYELLGKIEIKNGMIKVL